MAGTQQRRDWKYPLPLQMPFIKQYTHRYSSTHIHCCVMALYCLTLLTNLHFNFFLSLLLLLLTPSPFFSFFAFLALGSPGIPSTTSLSFPLSLSLAQHPARSLGSTAKQRAFENFNHFPANGVETICPPSFNSLVVAFTCGNVIMRSQQGCNIYHTKALCAWTVVSYWLKHGGRKIYLWQLCEKRSNPRLG